MSYPWKLSDLIEKARDPKKPIGRSSVVLPPNWQQFYDSAFEALLKVNLDSKEIERQFTNLAQYPNFVANMAKGPDEVRINSRRTIVRIAMQMKLIRF